MNNAPFKGIVVAHGLCISSYLGMIMRRETRQRDFYHSKGRNVVLLIEEEIATKKEFRKKRLTYNNIKNC